MTKIQEGEWTYEQDSYGDWRGWHISGLLRTRLKYGSKTLSALDAARQDVRIRRLQKCINGTWTDTLDRQGS